MNHVRSGIIGCGDVTEIKSGPGFQKAGGSELMAVMRRDAAKARDYAFRHRVQMWYSDAQRLIDDPRVDAVYVATPPDTHEEYALRVCAAGKPCYVEKPMTRNTAEARRMVSAFADRKLPLFIAYYRRAQPRFVKVRQLLEEQIFGPLQRVEYHYASDQMMRRTDPVPWRLQAEQAGAGLFLDLGSHALDLLDFFIGPLQNVRGQAANRGGAYDVEDRVDLSFTTKSGVPGSASWDFTRPIRRDEYVFTGQRGTLRISCFNVDAPQIEFTDGRRESFELPHPQHVQQPLIQMIVDELRGLPICSPSTGVSGLRTQEVMDIALESYYGGREDGFWKRAWPGNLSK